MTTPNCNYGKSTTRKLDVNNNYTDGTYGFAPLPIGYIELTVGTTARRLYYYAG